MAVNAHMADEQSERFQMRVAPKFLEAVDEWRRAQTDIPSRAEAIRRLVEAGIKATEPRSADRQSRRSAR